MPIPKLKYLFTAYYNDGTKYEQNPEDVSIKDPIRSCFYDIDHEKLQIFELKDEFGNSWKVFLTNGHFEFKNNFGGALIHAPPEFENLINFRVIFYRTHEVSPSDGEDKVVRYALGFQANRKTGGNIQIVIELY